jgi:hypothetical protein
MVRRLLLLAAIVGLVICQSDEGEDSVFPSLDLTAFGSRLAAVAADSDDSLGDEEAVAPEVRPCCFPTVWQGKVVSEFGFSGRRAVLSQAVDQIYVDGQHRRLAGNKLECHHRGHPLKYSYIMRVGLNKTADLYLFDKTAKKCRYVKLSHAVWKKQCIPANATLRAASTLGPSAGGLKVQSWTFQIGGRRSALMDADRRPHPRPKVFVSSNILVVPKSCVPVVIQEFGDISSRPRVDGLDKEDAAASDDADDDTDARPKPRPRHTGFVGGMYFTDVQMRITDPSVFTPPSYCKKTSTDLYYEDMGENLEDIIPSILEGYLMV